MAFKKIKIKKKVKVMDGHWTIEQFRLAMGVSTVVLCVTCVTRCCCVVKRTEMRCKRLKS
jgi:hypothetical protein